MKIITLTLACILSFSATLQAGAVKEIYSNAQEEIEMYYMTGGEYKLLKISNLDFVDRESNEFITLSAKTTIQNISTNKFHKETCLVTFSEHNLEFHTINCF